MEDLFRFGFTIVCYLPIVLVWLVGPLNAIIVVLVIVEKLIGKILGAKAALTPVAAATTNGSIEASSRRPGPRKMTRPVRQPGQEESLAHIRRETEAPRKRNGESALNGGAETKLASALTSEENTCQPSPVTAPQARIADTTDLERALVDARLQLRKLENTLATTQDIPEGKLLLRGRVVPSQGRLSIVTKGGKPFKVAVAQGWEFGADLGDQVLLEALWREETGWTAWRVIVEVLNAHLGPLDQAMVAKLTAKKEPKGAPNFDDLDREAAQNAVRVASHSKTAISLHMVFPTHCRFSLTEDQATDLKAIIVELVEEIDLGKVAAIEVGNTEGGNQRDHLHLLVTAFNHTGDSIGKQVGRLKALSSGRLRRKHPNLPEKLWSASYWVSSAGGSLDKVIAYIGDNAEKNAE